MDPENFAADIPDTATDEEAQAFAQAADDAFESSFGTTDGSDAPGASATPPAAGAPAPAPAGTKEESKPGAGEEAADPATATAAPPAAPADPFAGMPKEWRDAIAQVPTLAQDLRTVSGRLSKAQSELVELRKFKETAQAAAVEPPKTPNLDRIRKELPEVADAMEERLAQMAPSPAPAAPTQTVAHDPADDLAEAHPDWETQAGSPEFALYVGTRPDADKVRSSKSAAFMSSVLTEYKAMRGAQAERVRLAAAETAARSNRVAAAAAVPRGRARPAATPETQDEEAAFVGGFGGS